MQFCPSSAKLIQMTLILESVNGSVSRPLTVICHHFCLHNSSILHKDKKKGIAHIIVFIVRSVYTFIMQFVYQHLLDDLYRPIRCHSWGINPHKHCSRNQGCTFNHPKRTKKRENIAFILICYLCPFCTLLLKTVQLIKTLKL